MIEGCCVKFRANMLKQGTVEDDVLKVFHCIAGRTIGRVLGNLETGKILSCWAVTCKNGGSVCVEKAGVVAR